MIECADCYQILSKNQGPCPNCGSERRNILTPIQDILSFGQHVQLSIVQYNPVWTVFADGLQYLMNHLEEDPFKKFEQSFSMQAMVNTAMLVEGILTDCLEEEIGGRDNSGTERVIGEREMEYATWEKKKQYIKDLFGIEVIEFPQSDILNTLFLVRNNISHGRSYRVAHNTTIRSRQEDHSNDIEIKNKTYARVYAELEKHQLLPPLQQQSVLNIDFLFKATIAKYLYEAAILFLHAWLDQPQMKRFDKIQRDFNSIFGV
jgi:hypothetical protein